MKQVIAEAQDHWREGRTLEAGRMLYENLPEHLRPAWAASLLALAGSYWAAIPEVEAVVSIARDTRRWGEAHDAFQAVRVLMVEAEREYQRRPLYEGILHLAENVAKVTFSAYRRPAWLDAIAPVQGGFDTDAGWWLASNLQYIIEQSEDPELATRGWSALVAPYEDSE